MARLEMKIKAVKTIYYYINLLKYRMKVFRLKWLDDKPLVKFYVNGKLDRVITCNDLADRLSK